LSFQTFQYIKVINKMIPKVGLQLILDCWNRQRGINYWKGVQLPSAVPPFHIVLLSWNQLSCAKNWNIKVRT